MNYSTWRGVLTVVCANEPAALPVRAGVIQRKRLFNVLVSLWWWFCPHRRADGFRTSRAHAEGRPSSPSSPSAKATFIHEPRCVRTTPFIVSDVLTQFRPVCLLLPLFSSFYVSKGILTVPSALMGTCSPP